MLSASCPLPVHLDVYRRTRLPVSVAVTYFSLDGTEYVRFRPRIDAEQRTCHA